MKAKKKKMKPMTQMKKYILKVIIKYNHYYLATRKLTNI